MTIDHETGNPRINGEVVLRAEYIGRLGKCSPCNAVARLQILE